MTPRDRCFLVTFDNEPQLVSRFTTASTCCSRGAWRSGLYAIFSTVNP